MFSTKMAKASVKEADLSEWFAAASRDTRDDLNDQLRSLTNEFRKTMNSLRADLDKLENANLQNPDIPMRHRQIMEGNRTAYSNKLSFFLQNIKLPTHIAEVEDFAKKFNEDANNLSKSTMKMYQILQEFLANESKAVATHLFSLTTAVDNMKKLHESSGFSIVVATEGLINDLLEKRDDQKSLESTIEKKQNEAKEITVVIETTKNNIEKLKKDPMYKDLQDLQVEKKSALTKLNNKGSEVVHLFATIEKALKKYVRISYEDEKILASYIDSPIKAVFQDPEFHIVDVLDKMKTAIEKNKIELDPKKKGKTLETIETINKIWLQRFFDDYIKLKKEYKDLNEKIENITIEAKIEGLGIKLKEAEEFEERLKKEIASCEDELAGLEIEKSLEDIQNNTKTLINTIVTIE